MNRPSAPQWMTAAIAAAAVSLPAGGTLAAGGRHGASVTYRGPAVGMRFGPVRASITVRGGRIAGVGIDVTSDLMRSRFIERRVIPLLREETLQAQSAKINMVSGATQTSEAYIRSLHFAVKKAREAHALR